MIERQSVAPSFKQALAVWAKIGVLSFGGPAGQIALMHRVLVDERRWIDEDQFLRALNFCMLLPGPEAMQLATYVGWRLHGTVGGLAAGLLFVLPGASSCSRFPSLMRSTAMSPLVEAAVRRHQGGGARHRHRGIAAGGTARFAASSDWIVASAAFIAIFFFDVPFPLVIAAAAVVGYLLVENRPQTISPTETSPARAHATLRTVGALARALDRSLRARRASVWARSRLHRHRHLLFQARRRHLRRRLFGARLHGAAGGRDLRLADRRRDARRPGSRRDDAGASDPRHRVRRLPRSASATAANPSSPSAWLGAAITLWATFAPCFLWIFVGAPYVERLSTNPRLASALSGVTAAVVGVILNLSLWFALHVFFAKVEVVRHGPLRLWLPELLDARH